jgi:hypothetical protein
MKLSINTCHLVLLVAATCAATSAATQVINLGTACTFAILSKAGISTVPDSVITGDIGVSPIAATAMTGFSLTADASAAFSTSTQVAGQCLAADYGGLTPGKMTTAVSDMEAAYTQGNDRVATYAPNLGAGTVGGLRMYAGVYTFTVVITIDDNLTFDAQGDPNAVFIVTTTKELVLSAGKNVTLENGARADNIFWHVAGGAAGGVVVGAGAHMEGNILCYKYITFGAGSSLNGRALSQTAVTLDTATITVPAGCGEVLADLWMMDCH